MSKRIAFLLSGSGSTLANLLEHIETDDILAKVVKVLSSRSGVKGLSIAADAGIPSCVVRRRDHADTQDFSDAISAELDSCEPDLVVFGGFMCYYLPPKRYLNRIINVHPALIPAFCGKGMYGDHVHKAVLDYGVKVTGCTVHFVDEIYDHGPIIAQSAVKVKEDDTVETLRERVRAEERKLLPLVVKQYCEDRISVSGRKVRVLTAKENR
ncbi:MAG: phosphoribosylglycinamide formyltransferase [Planctomycetota bacterium]|nr:phosphoribosylglycinamide formyltransferase [Planctomycetota bacterium]